MAAAISQLAPIDELRLLLDKYGDQKASNLLEKIELEGLKRVNGLLEELAVKSNELTAKSDQLTAKSDQLTAKSDQLTAKSNEMVQIMKDYETARAETEQEWLDRLDRLHHQVRGKCHSTL
jgi:Skp family chaperone for outer membrane proteins